MLIKLTSYLKMVHRIGQLKEDYGNIYRVSSHTLIKQHNPPFLNIFHLIILTTAKETNVHVDSVANNIKLIKHVVSPHQPLSHPKFPTDRLHPIKSQCSISPQWCRIRPNQPGTIKQ